MRPASPPTTSRCGQYCCCKNFLKVLKPISMRSAKHPEGTLDPLKISGRCGRLMCCLRYEDETYDELRSRLPRKKPRVGTPEGDGYVDWTADPRGPVCVRTPPEDKRVAVAVEDLTELQRPAPARTAPAFPPPARPAAPMARALPGAIPCGPTRGITKAEAGPRPPQATARSAAGPILTPRSSGDDIARTTAACRPRRPGAPAAATPPPAVGEPPTAAAAATDSRWTILPARTTAALRSAPGPPGEEGFAETAEAIRGYAASDRRPRTPGGPGGHRRRESQLLSLRSRPLRPALLCVTSSSRSLARSSRGESTRCRADDAARLPPTSRSPARSTRRWSP